MFYIHIHRSAIGGITLYRVEEVAYAVLPVKTELDTFGAVAVQVLLRERCAVGVWHIYASVCEQTSLVFLEDIHGEGEPVLEQADIQTNVGQVGLEPGEVLIDQRGAGDTVADAAGDILPPSAAADSVAADILECIAGILTQDTPRRTQLEVAEPLDVFLQESLL